MELKNKALAGMTMEDDALENVTGGASLYEREYSRLERPGVELPLFELPKSEGPKLELSPLELPKLEEDMLEMHKNVGGMWKDIDD